MPGLAPLIEPDLPSLVDDFYEAVERHPGAAAVVSGGRPQIERLKGNLTRWVRGLFTGVYDDAYVEARWNVGLRHVEIGLDLVYTILALSRLRSGLTGSIRRGWTGPPEGMAPAIDSLAKALDLDLALIDDAYQAEYTARLQEGERLAKARDAERRYRILVHNSIDVITALDARGTILYQSPSVERVLGRPARDQVGVNIFQDPIVHPDDYEAKLSFFLSALDRPGVPVTGTFRLRHADGTYRRIEAVGTNLLDDPEVCAITANYRDVTARGRMEEELRMSEERFRVLVEAADCVIVMLRPDHSIAYFSPFAERLTGYAAEQVIGRNYINLFLPESGRQAVADEFDRAFEGKPTPGHQNPIVLRDRSLRWMVWNHHAVHDFEGGPALLKVGQDITYLKQAQERVLQAERLAAVGQMVAGIAHESRNALQRIQACLEMLARRVRGRPEEANLVMRIQGAQDQLHRLYEDVRGYAAPIILDQARCDLSGIWREAWSDLEGARAGRRATIEEAADGVELDCCVDRFRMKQVFCNVLENALAACADPVRVRIRCTPGDLDGRPSLVVSVLDDGPGFTAESREKVFEPFFTTKTKGTGLGMAIVRRIVEAHGGLVSIGEGSSGAEIIISIPKEPP